jgi:hypothetical protein
MSGCLKLDMDMKVKSNDKIDGTMLFAMSDALITMTGQSKADFIKQMKSGSKGAPAGSKTEVYDKDGFVGQKITFKDAPVDVFNQSTNATKGATPAGGGAPGDDLKLVKEGGKWKLTGVLDFGSAGTAKTKKDRETEKMLKGFAVRVRITFPGKIVEHDKDGKVSGKTITWEPKLGQKISMMAVANAS